MVEKIETYEIKCEKYEKLRNAKKYEKKCNIENTCKIIKKTYDPKETQKLILTLEKWYYMRKKILQAKLYKIVLKTTVHRHIRSISSHFSDCNFIVFQ